jgi:predicted enzyme related to lactoylglutathione lyase
MTLNLLINIDVPDLERGVEFYRDGLGFALRRWLFDRTVAELTCASVSCFLIEKRAGTHPVPGHDATRRYAPHWTPLHLDVVVPDVDLALTRAIAAGARVERPATDAAFGRIATLRDPFGHGFCLIALADGGYDNVSE